MVMTGANCPEKTFKRTIIMSALHMLAKREETDRRLAPPVLSFQ
jgi:hypothetical protein